MNLTRDYIAIVWAFIPGMAGAVITDIYAARDMACLTSMIRARTLSAKEYVRYGRDISV